MTRLILIRLAAIPLSLFVIVTLCFALVTLIPGDPAVAILGSFATDESVAELRAELGLDEPFLQSYFSYIGATLQGDLGESFKTGRPVLDEVQTVFPNTLELLIPSIIIAIVFGLGVGMVAAYYGHRLIGRLASRFISLLQAIPVFIMGVLLIFFIYFIASLAPAPTGRLSAAATNVPDGTGFLIIDTLVAGEWGLFGQALWHVMLPALTLGICYSAYFARTAQTTIGKALRSEQAEFARACGLPERTVLYYAWLDARTTLITYGAVLFAILLGGSTVTEVLFSWNGIGSWGYSGVLNVDLPVIRAFVLFAGAASLIIYLILDCLVLWLDPRVSY